MLSLGVNFKEDHDNIVNDIKSSISGEPMFIIFKHPLSKKKKRHIHMLCINCKQVVNLFK